MNKLKQFYKNNEKTILVCSGIALGSITTSYFAGITLTRVVDGMKLVNADVFDIPDSTNKVLRVTMQNGNQASYVWDYIEAVK